MLASSFQTAAHSLECVLAAGAFWLWKQKVMYHVVLNTSGGEMKALSSYQEGYVRKVVKALNDAIVHRG